MNYDLIIVGGGLAGSSLGGKLALAGYQVLILEREREFHDRIRGEAFHPWGVAASQRLGIFQTLQEAGGHDLPFLITYFGNHPVNERDLRETTPHRPLGALGIYHPAMQEALLKHAVKCGAEVRRGVTVVGLKSEKDFSPQVIFTENDQSRTESARIVVGADGKDSNIRHWGGFKVQKNPDLLMVAGILLEDCWAPEDAIHLVIGNGYFVLIAPQGKGKVRTYCVYPSALGWQLSGKKKIPEYLQTFFDLQLPEKWFSNAKAMGPLAEFSGADRWVDSPANQNIVLIGDAAASSDPSWGCGLSLTLLDVENLANQLLSTQDWSVALQQYAKVHDSYYSNLRRILDWMDELIWSTGPDADERRQRVFQRMFADPTGFPDHAGQGPHGPCDERARRLILGLET